MEVLYTQKLNDPIYQDALALRQAVFIEEQGVPAVREIDNDEAKAWHFVLYDQQKQPLATARLLPVSAQEVKLQRMAVSKHFRSQGLGAKLIQELQQTAAAKGFTCIKLGAQMTAVPFYEKLGFTVYGQPFTDAGLPHIAMSKQLS